MSDVDVFRAWKDARYRRSLSAEQRSALPANPAGLVELSDEQLKAAGGAAGGVETTAITCTAYSWQNWKACGCGPATTSITCTEYTWQKWIACCP